LETEQCDNSNFNADCFLNTLQLIRCGKCE